VPRFTEGGALPSSQVAFVIRAVLQRPSFDEALAVLLEAPHASGQNYTLAGPDGRVMMVEASSEGALVLMPPKRGKTRRIVLRGRCPAKKNREASARERAAQRPH
jgi:hypothetical protein